MCIPSIAQYSCALAIQCHSSVLHIAYKIMDSHSFITRCISRKGQCYLYAGSSVHSLGIIHWNLALETASSCFMTSRLSVPTTMFKCVTAI